MLVSFIIPCFNSERTIARCINSVYSLSLEETEFEIIVIDDCSTDKTVEILKQSQIDHTNLTVFCQSRNHRQGAARNVGIKKAIGEYVVFVDSDDEVSNGVLQALSMAQEKRLDMVAMRVSKINEKGEVESAMLLPYQQKQVFGGVVLQSEHPFWGTAPWPYVYRRAFLNRVNYHFAEDVLFEDSDFVNVHLYYAQRMSYCDVCGYHVYYNALSTTHTITYKHVSDYALLGTRMLAFYESLPDKTTKYADSILEGGSYNIMKSFKRLFRLGSISGVRSFYERFDDHFDRKQLLRYRNPAYCWTHWTRFCLKHSKAATIYAGGIGAIYNNLIVLWHVNRNRIQPR